MVIVIVIVNSVIIMTIIVISVKVTMSMRVKRNSMIIVNIVNLIFIILIRDSV